ncbi:MAG: glycosyltransferase [Phycisphaerales bacterium]|nr:glycosyltransferase [Phycisphaerales bacterium]
MSNSRKNIAVCVLSYNQRDYLIEVIDSILAQTRMPDQIVVVDDVSPDDSADVLRQYERDHPGLFTIKINETNQGCEVNRHTAMKESRCELTTWVDGDDLYYPDKIKLEEQCLIDNPDAGFVYSNMNIIDAKGDIIRNWTNKPQTLPRGQILDSVVSHNFPGGIHCRFMLTNTKALVEATKHSQKFKLYEDLAIYIQLSSAMKCAVVETVNHGYRQHEGCMHRTNRDLHFVSLKQIYTYFEHLFNQADPEYRKRIDKGCNQVLSSYAWRALKDHSKNPTKDSSKRVVELAKFAMDHNALSARPKHLLRLLTTKIKTAGLT